MNNQEVYHKILDLFRKFGIKSQNMDDISRYLGMSKKTLYKYCTDKTDLVNKVMEYQYQSECQFFDDLGESDLNAIDEFFEVGRHVKKELSQIQPIVIYDLQKYYPEAWKYMEKNEKHRVFETILSNINKGIKEGLYRENLKPKVIVQGYLAMMDVLFFQEDHIMDYSLNELYSEMFRYHIRGIASEKGIEYLKEKINKENLI